MTRTFLFTTLAISALCLAACTNSTTTTTSSQKRKVYYARDVQTGSNLRRSYSDPETTSATNPQMGSNLAGDRPFTGSSAAGSYAGQR